jgi:hypothetical protein
VCVPSHETDRHAIYVHRGDPDLDYDSHLTWCTRETDRMSTECPPPCVGGFEPTSATTAAHESACPSTSSPTTVGTRRCAAAVATALSANPHDVVCAGCGKIVRLADPPADTHPIDCTVAPTEVITSHSQPPPTLPSDLTEYSTVLTSLRRD